jgi:hypothetical protein
MSDNSAHIKEIAKQICEVVHRLPYYADSDDQIAAIETVLKEHYERLQTLPAVRSTYTTQGAETRE